MPELPARSAEERWAEAKRRARRMDPAIRAEIAAVKPPPVPEEVLSPPAPEAKPAPKRVEAAPPAPVPAEAAPKPRQAAAPRSEPPPAPSGRAAVPEIRVAQRYTTENGLPSNRIT
ncbi:MAG: hypothetical protein D6708_03390, partial [Candidatus Dadabacteria bacterium]